MADWGTGQGWGRVGIWDAAARRAARSLGPVSRHGRAPPQLSDRQHRTGPAAAMASGRLALYLAADREPAWWAGSGLAAVCCIIAIAARHRPIAFPIALALQRV